MGARAEWGERIAARISKGVAEFAHGLSSGARGPGKTVAESTAESVTKTATRARGGRRAPAKYIRTKKAIGRSGGRMGAYVSADSVATARARKAAEAAAKARAVSRPGFAARHKKGIAAAAVLGGTAAGIHRNRTGAAVTTRNPTGIYDTQGY